MHETMKLPVQLRLAGPTPLEYRLAPDWSKWHGATNLLWAASTNLAQGVVQEIGTKGTIFGVGWSPRVVFGCQKGRALNSVSSATVVMDTYPSSTLHGLCTRLFS
jgi:hypothetical protein